jgi:hypothetical protein
VPFCSLFGALTTVNTRIPRWVGISVGGVFGFFIASLVGEIRQWHVWSVDEGEYVLTRREKIER